MEPDAGDDGTLRNYQQFSLYNDFGHCDLLMAWSATLSPVGRGRRPDAAVRFLLRHHLYGPLGLADSSRWATGANEPRVISAERFLDTGLGTMALLEWLDGPAALSKSFAALPEVPPPWIRCFPPAPIGPGNPPAGQRHLRLPNSGRSQGTSAANSGTAAVAQIGIIAPPRDVAASPHEPFPGCP